MHEKAPVPAPTLKKEAEKETPRQPEELLNKEMASAQVLLLLGWPIPGKGTPLSNIDEPSLEKAAREGIPEAQKTKINDGSLQKRREYWEKRGIPEDKQYELWKAGLDKALGEFVKDEGKQNLLQRILKRDNQDINEVTVDADTIYQRLMRDGKGDVEAFARKLTREDLAQQKEFILEFAKIYGEGYNQVATLLSEGIINGTNNPKQLAALSQRELTEKERGLFEAVWPTGKAKEKEVHEDQQKAKSPAVFSPKVKSSAPPPKEEPQQAAAAETKKIDIKKESGEMIKGADVYTRQPQPGTSSEKAHGDKLKALAPEGKVIFAQSSVERQTSSSTSLVERGLDWEEMNEMPHDERVRRLREDIKRLEKIFPHYTEAEIVREQLDSQWHFGSRSIRDWFYTLKRGWDALAIKKYNFNSPDGFYARELLARYPENSVLLDPQQAEAIDCLAEAAGIPHKRGAREIQIPEELRDKDQIKREIEIAEADRKKELRPEPYIKGAYMKRNVYEKEPE